MQKVTLKLARLIRSVAASFLHSCGLPHFITCVADIFRGVVYIPHYRVYRLALIVDHEGGVIHHLVQRGDYPS